MRAQTLGLNDASLSGNNAQFFSGSNTSLGNFESTGNYLANSTGSLGGTIDFQTDTKDSLWIVRRPETFHRSHLWPRFGQRQWNPRGLLHGGCLRCLPDLL